MFTIVAGRLEDVRGRYLEPHRGHHGLAHPLAMIALQREAHAAGAIRMPDLQELATWYHDAFQVPGAKDNEERSAALLRAHMVGVLAPRVVRAGSLFVLATAKHAVPEALSGDLAAECAAFLDSDLAPIGGDEATFADFEGGIRFEYAYAPEEEYRRVRADVMERFALRPRIFLTDYFADRFEARARENIRRLVSDLRAGLAAEGPRP